MAIQSTAQLSSFFTSIINNVMLVEREPLSRLIQARDTVNVQRGVYADLKAKLDAIQLSARSLQSSDALFSLSLSRKVAISNQPSGYTVLTASAGSTAGTGSYDLSVTHLALAQRKGSAVQTSIDQALGKTGNFLLGGNGTAAADTAGSDMVTGVGTAAVGTNLREFATGTYAVETRNVNGTYQFRVKNVDGTVMAVADKVAADGTLTTSWQNVTAGSFDTKRGMTIDFAASGTATSTAVSYTAAGVSVEVKATDNLQQIAANINSALQPEGREVQATVVGKQMMFTALRTGTDHTMVFTDETSDGGFGFGADLQAARNSEFTVSGLTFYRASNSGIADVIAGVTLNLAADAETRGATLAVSTDTAPARKEIESFLSELTSLQKYISDKTSVTENGTGDHRTYTRGALADESSVYSLRTQLFSQVMSNVSSTSTYRSLREIGIGVTDDLQISVVDSDKLNSALADHFDEVKSLLDGFMQGVNTTLSRFTGSNGYLNSAISGLDRDASYKNTSITDLETRLDERQLYLINQYAQIQAQLTELAYAQQTWNSIYSATSSFNLFG